MASEGIKKMRKISLLFFFSQRHFTKGKDICKAVSFCCLATFIRQNVKDLELIICNKI